MGGTFDHLHKGHKALIEHAFNHAEKVIIGITSDEMVNDKDFGESIENYEERVFGVEKFLTEISQKQNYEIVKLDDACGPTLGKEPVDLLVCSPLTERGVIYINKKRQEIGLTKLPVRICEMQKATDGEYISSTRIRKGEINRDGFCYRDLFQKDILINKELENFCKNPFGILIKEVKQERILTALNKDGFNMVIGDLVSSIFIKNGIKARSFVFDGKTQREKLDNDLRLSFTDRDFVRINNKAGEISHELANNIENCFFNFKNIFVKGEEDLAVVAATLLLPLGTKIFYGQPNEGIVVTEITEERKETLREFLN